MVNSGAHTTADKGGVPSAAQHENDEAYLDYGFSAGRGEKPLYPTRTAAAATEQVAAYCNPGMHAGKAIPLSPQVVADKATADPAAAVGHDMNGRALAERVLCGLPILGLAVASSAVTGLATDAPTPTMGFGLFLMLLVGLSAASVRVLHA
ncbi:uncharacterized protein LOC133895762 [Phragmites australis]|uniref:uncharacterized protein LOC133895762 n=1 Tax=Phragmites australis TaxID=29695 RepID=UPI002D79BC11|nr:uncharacterized protein LOC133895762 [Phragmites australis]